MKAELELEDGKYIRHKLGICWEQWNELLFNVGMSFLEKWFEKNWLEIAQATNFWDLWTMHFVRDDIILRDRFSDIVQTPTHYENFKKAMVGDRALFANIDQHLRKR